MTTQYHDHYALEQALHDHVEADREQARLCSRGDHTMLATARPGVVVCRFCRMLGVCLWCGLTLPPGACIVACAKHVSAVNWQAKQHAPRPSSAGKKRQQEQEREGHPDDLL